MRKSLPPSDLPSVEVSASPRDKFEEFLATRSLRLTPERAAIVDEVFSSHRHFDGDELTARLIDRKGDVRVSRATVYRALRLMVEAGLLRRVARPNGREVYEHDYGYPQHDHFICRECGQLIEFQNAVISRSAGRGGGQPRLPRERPSARSLRALRELQPAATPSQQARSAVMALRSRGSVGETPFVVHRLTEPRRGNDAGSPAESPEPVRPHRSVEARLSGCPKTSRVAGHSHRHENRTTIVAAARNGP